MIALSRQADDLRPGAETIAVFHAATALASSFLRKVAGLADVPAILVGTLVTRGGIKGIQIKSIEKQKT